MGSRLGVTALAVVIAVLPVARAPAQTERTGNANSQLAALYQEAVAAKNELQAENDRLKQQLDRSGKELAATKRAGGASDAKIREAQDQLQAAQTSAQTSARELEQTKMRLQELIDKYRELAVNTRSIETDKTRAEEALARSKAANDRCVTDNSALYQLDLEVLDRYEHQGAFSYLARAEPFTKIKRAEIENLVDRYRARAEELRVEKASATAPGATPAGGR